MELNGLLFLPPQWPLQLTSPWPDFSWLEYCESSTINFINKYNDKFFLYVNYFKLKMLALELMGITF